MEIAPRVTFIQNWLLSVALPVTRYHVKYTSVRSKCTQLCGLVAAVVTVESVSCDRQFFLTFSKSSAFSLLINAFIFDAKKINSTCIDSSSSNFCLSFFSPVGLRTESSARQMIRSLQSLDGGFQADIPPSV